MFQVGDKIFYPMHGAGIIENIEEREVLGMRKNYYILQFPFTNMTILLPIDTVEKVGLREIVDKKSLRKVETFLREAESPTVDNWQQRYRENVSILKGGDIFGLAQVVKSLILRSRSRGLSNSEKRLLEDAKQYLISEIALIKNIEEEEADQFIEDTIP
ncbi:CarD family transcriptional regulator [Ammoniphilus oxalaticus]|uniref:CarD family transcriptional regulator n=1 Tax=Ammoniphilus oxalaticus TaxID=66863 RepID=A0A419SJH0_9BACL|nr:CarD family transcriptional regulator [Ammoniphilus oxalaticus]RKD24048.1 CarD family transcriptional regulator [Ammoniphilus oxalaticus]